MARGNSHVEALVPVRVESFLHYARSVCLLGIDGDDSERVRETEDLALGETIGSDDWGPSEARTALR